MENLYLEVDLKKYCESCENKELDEKYDPCCECLESGYNSQSKRPFNWKEEK